MGIAITNWWRRFAKREHVEQQLDAELRFHFDNLVAANLRAGMNEAEARRRARLEFGGMAQVKEECRDAWALRWFEDLLRDVRFAIRSLRKNPGFALTAIATLALGIGVNVAIFSLVNAFLLTPLPYRDAASLIVAWDTYLPRDMYLPMFPKIGVSPPELKLWQEQTDIFEDTAWYCYVSKDLALTAPGAEAVMVHGGIISSSLMRVLGVAPALGGRFTDRGSPNFALLSDHLWQTRFAGDRAIVGKTIRLNDDVFNVSGVMPADFQFPDWADLWLPAGPLMGDELTNPVRHATGFIGRLRPGITAKQAATRLTALSTRLTAENPKTSTDWSMRVSSLQEDLTMAMRPALTMLFGAVALVLLIAIANVANLLLARATGRRKEIAIRRALGAGGRRVARQMLTESLILALIGGGSGLAIGKLALRALSPVQTPLDSTVLLFLLAISFATGVAFGFAPAFQASRTNPNAVLASGSVTGRVSGKARATLVVTELALALVLIASAGILAKSFLRLQHVDPGFGPKGLLTMRISFPPSRKPDVLFRLIEERVRQLPGVDSFASTTDLPLTAKHGNAGRFNVPGSPLINPDSLPAAQLRYVSPSYFAAMHIPVHSGRVFTDRDLKQPVVVVNETMARHFWPGQNPVGLKFITGPWGPNPTWSTIIGVVGDVKQFGLDSEPSLDLYFPDLFPSSLIIHTAGDPKSLVSAARSAIRSADPDLPISEIRTMDQEIEDSSESRRWVLALVASFAALALILALIGIYGVVSYSVTQRTQEIGICVALGAPPNRVRNMIVLRGMRLALAGVAIGIAVALGLTRLIASLLYAVQPRDPVIFVVVPVILMMMAFVACWLPARRTTRINPSEALRYE